MNELNECLQSPVVGGPDICVCGVDYYQSNGKCKALIAADLPCKTNAMCTHNSTCTPDIPESLCR